MICSKPLILYVPKPTAGNWSPFERLKLSRAEGITKGDLKQNTEMKYEVSDLLIIGSEHSNYCKNCILLIDRV